MGWNNQMDWHYRRKILVMDIRISEVLLKSDRSRTLETKVPFIMIGLKYGMKGIDHALTILTYSKTLPLTIFKIPSNKV